jgi:hypothetical protein
LAFDGFAPSNINFFHIHFSSPPTSNRESLSDDNHSMWIAGSLLFKHLGSSFSLDLGGTHYIEWDRRQIISVCGFWSRATETRCRTFIIPPNAPQAFIAKPKKGWIVIHAVISKD